MQLKALLKRTFLYGLYKKCKMYKEIYNQLTISYGRNMDARNYCKAGDIVNLAPNMILNPQYIELDNFVRLQDHLNVISWKGKVIIKKYTGIGAGCTIIPGSHTPTVGLPQFATAFDHINDVDGTVVINEDCWIGAKAILLSKCEIGRGAVVGAGSIVTKKVPPYAVVAGVPAKIIAARFSIEQIIAHEKILYPPEERMSLSELHNLFDSYFDSKKVVGTSVLSESDKRKLEETKRKLGMMDFSDLD